MIRFRSRFASHTQCRSSVSSVICPGLPSVGFQLLFVAFQRSTDFPLARLNLGYRKCFGTTRVSGMRLTCLVLLSCDLTMCATMLVVSACSRTRELVIRSCQWTPNKWLLKLFDHFHIATVGYQCITVLCHDETSSVTSRFRQYKIILPTCMCNLIKQLK